MPIKFTERGYIRMAVRTETRDASSTTIRCTVSDTGIGIAREHQQHLFQVFTQVDGLPLESTAAQGWGLAISKQLVTMMGGRDCS